MKPSHRYPSLSCYIEGLTGLALKEEDPGLQPFGESAFLSGQESRCQTQNPSQILLEFQLAINFGLKVAEFVSRKCGKLWVEPGGVYNLLPPQKDEFHS